MTFDPNKVTEVEGMTAIDFGVWKSGKHAEVRPFLDEKIDIVLHFYLQISTYTSGGTSLPGRTLLSLAVVAYTDSAGALRHAATMETSNRVLGYSRENKEDHLRMLRGQYENGRKIFYFALVNAGEVTWNIILHSYTYTFLILSQRTLGRCQGHRGGRHGSVRRRKEEARVCDAAQARLRNAHNR